MTVADTSNPVLVPAVRSGSGVVVREVFPGIAIWTIVLANGAPGTLAQVRAPPLPVRPPLTRLFQSAFLLCHSAFPRLCVNKGRDQGGLFPTYSKRDLSNVCASGTRTVCG